MYACAEPQRNVRRIAACKSCQKLSAKNMFTKTKQIAEAGAAAAAAAVTVVIVIVVTVFRWS